MLLSMKIDGDILICGEGIGRSVGSELMEEDSLGDSLKLNLSKIDVTHTHTQKTRPIDSECIVRTLICDNN